MRVKSDQMNFVLFTHNRKDCSESIVQSISFHNELGIRNLMHKDRSEDECLIEEVKSIIIEGIKLPENVFLSKTC